MDKNILNERLMGPDCTIILNELLEGYENNDEIRILDLGCGKGLTSIIIAENIKMLLYMQQIYGWKQQITINFSKSKVMKIG